MITNPDIVARFEHLRQKTNPLSIAERFALLEGMYELAVKLDGLRPDNQDEHLRDTVQLVHSLHALVQTPAR